MNMLKFISYTKAKKLFSEVAGNKNFSSLSDLITNQQGKDILEGRGLVYGYNTEAPDANIWTITDHSEDYWGENLPLTKYDWEVVKEMLQEDFGGNK